MKPKILYPSDIMHAYSVFIRKDMYELSVLFKNSEDIIIFPNAYTNIDPNKYYIQLWHIKSTDCYDYNCIFDRFHNCARLSSMDSLTHHHLCNSLIMLNKQDVLYARDDIFQDLMFNYNKLG